MRRSILSTMCIVAMLLIDLGAPVAMADEDDRLSVPVAFGRDLNNAQPGNKGNHVILPNHLKVKQDGQDAITCFCPAVLCSHGRMAGCIASCYVPKQALCHCEATCDLYAKPVGRNLCRCD